VLPKETISHIQSAGCLGQKEVVTAVHNTYIRELLQEIDVHGKADRHMKLLTLERESSLGSLWDQEQCAQFCSKDLKASYDKNGIVCIALGDKIDLRLVVGQMLDTLLYLPYSNEYMLNLRSESGR
jgi:hypothetical protein